MDIWDKKKRSEVMSRIRSKDTKIELLVRRWIFAFGYRYRINDKRYPGKPDIVLPKYRTVIFVHGCFWHGHDCKIAHMPKTNQAFWADKISRNIERDAGNVKQLESMGWNVIVVWECELTYNADERLLSLLLEIRQDDYSDYSDLNSPWT